MLKARSDEARMERISRTGDMAICQSVQSVKA